MTALGNHKKYYHLAYPWRDGIAKYETFALESKTDMQNEICQPILWWRENQKKPTNIIFPKPELKAEKEGETKKLNLFHRLMTFFCLFVCFFCH